MRRRRGDPLFAVEAVGGPTVETDTPPAAETSITQQEGTYGMRTDISSEKENPDGSQESEVEDLARIFWESLWENGGRTDAARLETAFLADCALMVQEKELERLSRRVRWARQLHQAIEDQGRDRVSTKGSVQRAFPDRAPG